MGQFTETGAQCFMSMKHSVGHDKSSFTRFMCLPQQEAALSLYIPNWGISSMSVTHFQNSIKEKNNWKCVNQVSYYESFNI